MTSGLIVMGVLLAVLLAVVGWRGGVDGLWSGLERTGEVAVDFGPMLVLAIVMMAFIEELLPRDLVQTWLSDEAGWRGIVVAWIGGILTPAGSLVGLPIAAGLAKGGAGSAVVVTYLVSFSTLSVVRVPLELGIIGPKLTALRIAACLILPPIAGAATWLGVGLYR